MASKQMGKIRDSPNPELEMLNCARGACIIVQQAVAQFK